MLVSELKAFYAVARCGTVTKAATQLGVSQPTVTGQLRQLEARYGIELFHRQGRGLQLSAQGERLLPLVERLVQQESEIEFRLRDASDLRGSSLRIGATGPFYIMPTLQRYHERYPTVAVSLSIGNSQAMLTALQDYRIEVATSAYRVDDERLHRQTIAVDPLRVVTHRDHALARAVSVGIADLAEHTLLLREPGSMTRQVCEGLFAQAGVRPHRELEIGSRESIREGVLCGLGISLMPAREVSADPQLVAVPLRDGDACLSEYLYCLRERQPVQTIARFLELAPSV